MDNEALNIKKINPEADYRNDSNEVERSSRLLSRGVFDKSTQLFRGIVGKLSRVGKDSYITALSTISASKRAGKTAVLKMEITSKKRKMKEFFSKLGERVYGIDGGKTPPPFPPLAEKVSRGSTYAGEGISVTRRANIFEDAPIRDLIDTLKSYDHEVQEIEQYIASLGPSLKRKGKAYPLGLEELSNAKKTIDNTINEPGEKGDGSIFLTPSPFSVTGALSETQQIAALSTYVEAIKDEDAGARIRALKQLFKFDGLEAIPHLVGALRDKDTEVRRRAALYLGWKMAVSALPPLIVVTNDRNPSVRRASLEALGELGRKEAVPALIKGLDDQDYEVRKTADKSLRRVTGKFIEFNANGPLSERFKSIQKWERLWKGDKK